jgi:hypothetical protein
LVVTVGLCHQPRDQCGPCHTLSDNNGIVPERFKKFAQHLWLSGVLRHALHFSL